MTPTQKRLRDLRDRQSRERGRMAELSLVDELTDEQRAELDTIERGTPDLERQTRAATVALEDKEREAETRDAAPGAEERERIELRSRCRVGNILAAALAGRGPTGPEAEHQSDLGFATSDIPTELWQRPERRDARETRAITATPSTVGVNMADVEPFVFAPSIASRLGISFRSVPSGTYAVPTITTAPSTAAPKAKSGAADATAGAMTVTSATPKRVPARLELAVEDVAAFGNETFEASLREALSAKLSDSLDNQVINGDGQAPNLNGLIAQLTAPTAQGALVTWSSASEVAAAFIDGLWASMLSDLAVAINPEGYRKLATTFQAPTTSGANGEISAASYLMDKLNSLFTNRRMPSTPGSGSLDKNATLIVARMGQPGLTRAIIPDWMRVSVDDIFSGSAKGERYFTVSAIVGDVLIVQADAFALGTMQVKA